MMKIKGTPTLGLAGLCLALQLTIGLTQPALADDGATCLQEQLAALGFDPGSVDGQIGPATRHALAAYEAANTPLSTKTLDQSSDIVFCRQLGLRDAALTIFWPSIPQSLQVEVAGGRDDDLRLALLVEARKALNIVQSQLAIRLAGRVTIVIGSNAAEIAEVAKGFADARPATVERFAKRACGWAMDSGGVRSDALPGVILLCHRPDQLFGMWFNELYFRNQLGRLIAWEAINQLTGDFGTGTDAEYNRANGPIWLMVGTMQLVQREVDGNMTPLGKVKAAEKLRAAGLPNPEALELYQSNLEDPVLVGDTGLLATYDLTIETGLAPVGRFYQALGTGAAVEGAFTVAFGQSMTDFYQRYP